jgi:AcrR family transcriptional regulator
VPPSASIRSLSRAVRNLSSATRDRAPGDLGRRDGVALRDLGVAVGLRQPSLYVYFASKLDLYDAMFADGHRQLLELWRSGGTVRTASGAVHVCRRPRAVRWVRHAEQVEEPQVRRRLGQPASRRLGEAPDCARWDVRALAGDRLTSWRLA